MNNSRDNLGRREYRSASSEADRERSGDNNFERGREKLCPANRVPAHEILQGQGVQGEFPLPHTSRVKYSVLYFRLDKFL